MARPPPDRRRGRHPVRRASPPTPRNASESAAPGRPQGLKVPGTFERRRAPETDPRGRSTRSKVSGTFEGRRREGDAAGRSKGSKVPGTFEARPERPLREDLVTQ